HSRRLELEAVRRSRSRFRDQSRPRYRAISRPQLAPMNTIISAEVRLRSQFADVRVAVLPVDPRRAHQEARAGNRAIGKPQLRGSGGCGDPPGEQEVATARANGLRRTAAGVRG